MQVPKYSGVSHTRRKKSVKLKGINVSVSCEEVSRTDFKRSTIFGRSGLKITGSQEENNLLKRMTVKERQEIGQHLHGKRVKGGLFVCSCNLYFSLITKVKYAL